MGQARTVVETAFELFNARDAKGLRKIYTDDCELTIPGLGTVKGADQVVDVWEGFFTAFPDGHLVAQSWVEYGDAAVTEHTFTGTHTGPLMGPQGEIPSTGRKVTLDAIVVYRVDGEQATSVHLYYDQMDFLGQLGLMPGAGGR